MCEKRVKKDFFDRGKGRGTSSSEPEYAGRSQEHVRMFLSTLDSDRSLTANGGKRIPSWTGFNLPEQLQSCRSVQSSGQTLRSGRCLCGNSRSYKIV